MPLLQPKVKFKRGYVYKEGGPIAHEPVSTLQQALTDETVCGIGIESICYGFVVLPDWNSTTGQFTRKAVYVVDGVLKVGTIDAAKAEIQGYKDIAGTGGQQV